MNDNLTHASAIRQVKAVLFDMDGTLVDTDDQAVAALARRLRPLLGSRSHRIARWAVMKAETPGNAFITLLDMLHVDELMRAIASRRPAAEPDAHPFHLISGVESMVRRVAAQYQVGLVTTRGRREIDHFLHQFPAFGDVVVVSCGREDTRRLKPHPAPVMLAAEQLGLPPQQCVMVGDTTVDIRSGRRAGAWAVGVCCGFGTERELWRTGAHAVLASTADVADFLGCPG